MKAMLLAAGLGTRLQPFTLKHPKALALVNGKTVLERNIQYLKSFGVKEIVINVHHFAQQIINFLKENKNFGIEIIISDETEMVLETGGGILFAKNFLEGEKDFLVMNVDILTDLNLNELISFHKNNNALASLAISQRQSSRQLLFNTQKQLCGWKNQANSEEKIARQENETYPFSFSGIQVLSPNIFSLITQKGKFSIIDTYLELAKENSILGFEHDAILKDIGSIEKINEAEKIFF
jgi:MurNAc alpha-1-phosphate uridylyltransferase